MHRVPGVPDAASIALEGAVAQAACRCAVVLHLGAEFIASVVTFLLVGTPARKVAHSRGIQPACERMPAIMSFSWLGQDGEHATTDVHVATAREASRTPGKWPLGWLLGASKVQNLKILGQMTMEIFLKR